MTSFTPGAPSPWRAEDNPTLGKIHASVESPRSPDAGGSQAYSKPTPLRAAGASRAIPTGVLRSLAAADHRALGLS